MVHLAGFPKAFLDDIIVHKTMPLLEWVRLASTLDVDGIEMYSVFFDGKGEGFEAEVRAACEKAELEIPMMCFSPDFTQPDLAERKRELQRQMDAVDLTARLGGQFCRTLSGQTRPGLDVDRTVGWCAEMIREGCAYAQTKGVTLVMENHYKDSYWTHHEFALRSEVFLRIVAQVDSPAFGINYDPSNAVVAGEDPIALLREVKGLVRSMHASDRYLEGGSLEDLRKMALEPGAGYTTVLKHGIIGQGLNDYDEIFSILPGAGFDGWVSIEDGMNGMEDLRASVAFLRKKIAAYFG